MVCPLCFVGLAGSAFVSAKSLLNKFDIGAGPTVVAAGLAAGFLYNIGLIPFLCSNIKSAAYSYYDNILSYDEIYYNNSFDEADVTLIGEISSA